jgi:hypothetical protein
MEFKIKQNKETKKYELEIIGYPSSNCTETISIETKVNSIENILKLKKELTDVIDSLANFLINTHS